LTEDYNLELQYRKPFLDIWEEEKDDRELGPLSERMGVRNRATGELNMTEEEKDAVSKYFLIRCTLPLLTLIQVSIMPFASTRSKPVAPDWLHAMYICILTFHLKISLV
jgi:hypothetical protein